MKKKKSKKFKKVDEDDIVKAFVGEEKPEPETSKKAEQPEKTKAPQKKPAVQPQLEVGKFAGVDRSSAQKLKRGKYKVEAVLDLHGYTVEQAYFSFRNFIDSCFRQNMKCVMVITGKGSKAGTGLIKSNITEWVNLADMRPKIIAVSRAAMKDGGEGAVYILLKRKKTSY